MRVPRVRDVILALALCAPLARAQQAGVISGTIVHERTGAPIPGTRVEVEGSRVAAVSDNAGRFRLAGLTGAQVSVTARRIGFRPATVTVAVGSSDVRIALAERALELSSVVVTGTAGIAEKRALGNAVTTVNAADVTATQPVRSFQELLTGRAAGVSVIASSGQVGTGSRIRVRGASSLSLSNDPLIYVDGVRVDNLQASGPTNQAFGSRSVSRWNDFNPDDIESLELIKGPAAATLYGTEASNGVIQIITKKGVAGRATWNFAARLGANYVPNWRTRFFTNYGTVPRAGSATALDTVTITIAQLNDSLRAFTGNDIFRTGALRDYQLSVSGGTPALRYYVGGGYEQNEGAERGNHLSRANFRANISATPGATWDVLTSVGYTTGRTYLPYESGGGGATWATYFSSPSFLYRGRTPGNPQRGFRSSPPDIYYQLFQLYQDADRFTGSVQFNHRPTSWLNHRLIVGADRLAENNQDGAPRNDAAAAIWASHAGSTSVGYLETTTRDATYITADYLANGTWTVSPALRTVTSAGGQFYGRRTRNRALYGEGFPSAGVFSLNAATIQQLLQDDLIENNTLGGFLQEQVVWNDRLFVTAAVRRDDNSSFGTNYPAVTYPKLSASYVLSEEPALHVPEWFTTLRLRGAYGGTGLQPGAFDAIRTYAASGGVVTPQSLGNKDLGPERSYEFEMGLDAGMWSDRLSAELTYFSGRTKDAILSRQAPPSGGFPGLQFFNAGQVNRHGLEWLLRAQPVEREQLLVDLTLSGSTNSYRIASMGPGTDFVSLSSNVAHRTGYAPGGWWDRRIVSADYNPTTRRTSNLMCDDGKGGTTPCAGAPRVFLGNTVPTREGSLSTGVTAYRNWRLNALFDWRGGYKKLDGNFRVRCGAFALCRELYYPDEVQDKVLLGAVQSGLQYTFHLIKDASFTRFRELSLTYTLPTWVARRASASGASITLAGRNLALWTKYPGVDPEASFNGGSRGGAYGQWEQNVLPQLRTIVTTFNLNF
ncbi:MAG: SusC/RagA family TonB-linked outer membrane protein [Gemmatimonadaceae bacterium]